MNERLIIRLMQDGRQLPVTGLSDDGVTIGAEDTWPGGHGAGSGKIARSDAELIQLVRRWVIYDWLRVAMIAVSFISSIRAISVPFPSSSDRRPHNAAWAGARSGCFGT